MKFFFKSLLLLPAFMPLTLFAQLHKKGTPAAAIWGLQSPHTLVYYVDTVNLDTPSRSSIAMIPLQAGVVLPLKNNIIVKSGTWNRVAAGHFVWRVLLEVPSAKALNVYFTNFNLNIKEQLFIYSDNMKRILGAFTAQNNGDYFTTGLIAGSRIIVELNTSKKIDRLPFRFYQLGVVLQQERGFGDAGSCEVPVNCNEGLEWQHQKRGVARILVKQSSSLFWCTGSLVNNTRNDGKPYFLTANHCGQGSSADDYSQWVFDFDYESPDCSRPVNEPDNITFTGAQLVANGITPRTTNSDFKLLLLNEEVPDEYHLFFNGWDRSGDVPQHGVVIHHPSGDIKYVSTYTNPAVSSFYYGAENSAGSFWKVYWSETENGYGVTEGGSSGSPLFNQDRLIVGALTGGNASCSQNTEPDYFGKFSESWSNNGLTDADRLKPWLDPDNTGVTKLEGYFKGSNIIVADFNSNSTKIIKGNYVEFNNLSEGNITNYRWEFEGGAPSFSSEKEPGLVYYEKPGTYGVKLVASSVENADSLIRTDYITVIGNIYPNPLIIGSENHNKIHILTGDTPVTNIEVYIYDITGKLLMKLEPQTGDREITVDPFNLSAGTYLISTVIFDERTTYKLVIVNDQNN